MKASKAAPKQRKSKHGGSRSGPQSKAKTRYQRRLQVRALRKRGAKPKEICERLGITLKELRKLEGHKPKPRADQLNGSAWQEFLERLTVEREGEPREVAGVVLEDTQARAYFRWMTEGVVPTIFSADRFLVAIDMHIDDYFDYCEGRGVSPWAAGAEPDWHRLTEGDD